MKTKFIFLTFKILRCIFWNTLCYNIVRITKQIFQPIFFINPFCTTRWQHHNIWSAPCTASKINNRLKYTGYHFFLISVLCFSACSTIFSSTVKPLRLLTLFMYFLARFSTSDFSPKCAYSSSVRGVQKGSTSTTWKNLKYKFNRNI